MRAKNVLERLLLNSTGLSDDECWEYQGKCAGSGGHIRIRRDDTARILAHRLAWEAHYAEPIPDGLCVLHHCDNPKCFNPAHLFLGTIKDNVHDMMRKGRNRPPSKLTKEQRAEIAVSPVSSTVLAAQYGVTSARIRQIKRGV
jgi:hypothetical protein